MERKSWMDAIQKQGEPKVHQCSATAANTEGIYEDISDIYGELNFFCDTKHNPQYTCVMRK